jgi:signal recognition particle GTPase
MPEVIDVDTDGLHSVESVDNIHKSLSHTLSQRGRKPRGAAWVQFQDQNLKTEYEFGDSTALSQPSEDDLGNTAEIIWQAQKTSQEKRKLVIIMVGLPGRGKTYLCNKLMCYLNWCGRNLLV